MNLHLIKPNPNCENGCVPLFATPVCAGFPSPAIGYESQELNLHDYCVKNKPATFFLRVSGHSMKDGRIHNGDVLVVDRSLKPVHQCIVVASVDNEFTVKQLLLRPKPCLMPLNPAYAPIFIDVESERIEIWGVVTFSIMGHWYDRNN